MAIKSWFHRRERIKELQTALTLREDAHLRTKKDLQIVIELLQKTEAQLPEGMKDCIIVCKQCRVLHSWLTATNWIDHGCPTCAREKVEAELAALKITHEELILSSKEEQGM